LPWIFLLKFIWVCCINSDAPPALVGGVARRAEGVNFERTPLARKLALPPTAPFLKRLAGGTY